MSRGSTLLALCGSLLWPLGASAADLNGAWVIHADWGPKLRYDLLCALKQEGASISGPCMVIYGYVDRAAGSLRGDALEFEYSTTYQGYDLNLTYAGKRQPDGLVRGSVTAGPTTGVFDGAALDDPATAWLFNVKAGLDYQLLCAFKASGGVLRGPCAPVGGSVLHASGRADDKSFELSYDTDLDGRRLHVRYSGPRQPDGSVKGEAAQADSKGTFTAKRR